MVTTGCGLALLLLQLMRKLYIWRGRVSLASQEDMWARQQVWMRELETRGESEDALTLLDELIPSTKSLFNDAPRLVDVGTGSGILAISAKLAHPELDVYGLDISRHALMVSQKNAAHHEAEVHFSESDLLENFPFTAKYIVANLPYVDKTWDDVSPELRHEPRGALFAADGGLKLIKKLLEQTPRVLTDDGMLLLEADPTQHAAIKTTAAARGLQPLKTRGYYLVFTKIA